MSQPGFLRKGTRTLGAFLIFLSLSAASLAGASGAPADNRYVQVEDDGLVKYLLDTATAKQYTGLSGQSLVDVWVEGRIDAGAGSRVHAFLGGYPPGVDYSQVAKVRVRYLFRTAGLSALAETKAAVIERQYFDLAGRIIHRESSEPPVNASGWRDLNETEKKALQPLLEPAFRPSQRIDKELQKSTAARALDEGFLGWPWGAVPDDFAGARHIADLAAKVSVYSADLDLSPILGNIKTHNTPLLVFEDGGLVNARIAFDPRDYVRVHLHLVGILGDPAPIIYEMTAARLDVLDRSEWFVGINTKVVLTSRLAGATLEIGRRDSLSLEGRKLEERAAEAQLKQAREYERQNRIAEASSLCQELLNGANISPADTAAVAALLAACSGRNEAVEFLGKNGGYAFSRLLNLFSGAAEQYWLRIDLDQDARAELRKHRPAATGPEDRLTDITAALCRVRFVPAAGKFAVIEQIWLDAADRIIGARPAGAPQDAAWPAPYIKLACEDFLEAWFTVGSAQGPRKVGE